MGGGGGGEEVQLQILKKIDQDIFFFKQEASRPDSSAV